MTGRAHNLKFAAKGMLLERLEEEGLTAPDSVLRRILREGLDFGDLKSLVLSVISIDRHKPKIDTEENVVVMAFTVMHEDPAQDLAHFIETGAFELLDVDVSPGPTVDGTYRVFVEMVRDHELYGKIKDILEDVEQVTGKDGDAWTFIPMGMDGEDVEFNRENFKKHIIDRSARYRMDVVQPKEEERDLEASGRRLDGEDGR